MHKKTKTTRSMRQRLLLVFPCPLITWGFLSLLIHDLLTPPFRLRCSEKPNLLWALQMVRNFSSHPNINSNLRALL